MRVQIDLEVELVARLDNRAEEHGISRADLIAGLLAAVVPPVELPRVLGPAETEALVRDRLRKAFKS